VALVKYLVKKEQLDGDLKRLQDRYADLERANRDLLQEVAAAKTTGTAALVLKTAIDVELESAMKMLRATASSILVPLPANPPNTLIFLSVHGPVASKLRRTTVAINRGIAGHVYVHGQAYRAADAHADTRFNRGVDVISSYTTTDMLCVPIRMAGRVAGVVQFLNKFGGDTFNESDGQAAQRFADSIASKVVSFTADDANFELIGFSPREQSREGSVLFCDMTASSLLLDTMDFASAISLMNTYLERHCEVAMRFGGTVDKLLGDGAMLRFNVPHPISDHKVRALQSAKTMIDDFQKLKEGWLASGFPVSQLFTRIGIASGPLRQAIMGHPQYQSLTIVGDAVILASNLCAGAPRDRNVILVTESTLDSRRNRF
jgi:class 3 adenylate cyclase